MLDRFFPTYDFPRACDITPEFLRTEGIRAIISDLDDTLTCHDSQDLAPEYRAWMEQITAAGIRFCILSNNSEERTRPFCDRNGLDFTAHARKPLRKAVLETLDRMGVTRDEALLVGDQIFTDILCGKNAGIRTAAVKPIGGRATRFIAVKRFLERPIWRAYFRRKEDK
ncbi:MAG: YqeG family HAD IIIA-type phosphatase [Clostridia bacterium]|nr:YqeG family HAD IIIA-type phosphatase [Clostridia bacterium]